MKIDANVEFSETISKEIGEFACKVPIDMDYVTDDVEDITYAVQEQLEAKWKRPFLDRDFIITNMDELLEELKFDEFERKVN